MNYKEGFVNKLMLYIADFVEYTMMYVCLYEKSKGCLQNVLIDFFLNTVTSLYL
jgi:hypothetical protein